MNVVSILPMAPLIQNNTISPICEFAISSTRLQTNVMRKDLIWIPRNNNNNSGTVQIVNEENQVQIQQLKRVKQQLEGLQRNDCEEEDLSFSTQEGAREAIA